MQQGLYPSGGSSDSIREYSPSWAVSLACGSKSPLVFRIPRADRTKRGKRVYSSIDLFRDLGYPESSGQPLPRPGQRRARE